MGSPKPLKSHRGGGKKRDLEQKRARNRESQRSFRERRVLRIKELEARIEALSGDHSERNARLIAENDVIRASWARAKQQTTQLQMLLKNLEETLNTEPPRRKETPGNPASEPPLRGSMDAAPRSQSDDDQRQNSEDSMEPPVPSIQSNESKHKLAPTLCPLHSIDPHNPDVLHGYEAGLPGCDCSDEYAEMPAESLDSLDLLSLPAVPSAPEIHDTAQDDVYKDVISMLQGSSNYQIPSQNPFAQADFMFELNPNQYFQLSTPTPPGISVSEFLEATETLLKAYLKLLGGQVSKDFLNRACLVMMVLFSRYVWPGPPAMLFGSFCYATAESMLLWRLNEVCRSRIQLPLYLLPSESQLGTPHPLMISWVTVAPLREQILQRCRSNSDFDHVWLDLMAHAVVEVEEISSILTGVGHGRGYLGIWNIFEVFGEAGFATDELFDQTRDGEERFRELERLDSSGLLRTYRMRLPDTHESSTSSAPRLGAWEPVSVEQLFSSPTLARQLYYHLELYNSHKWWRVDPAFFEKYKYLAWDGYQKYTARGISLRMVPRSLSNHTARPRELILNQFQQELFKLCDPGRPAPGVAAF